MVSKISDFLTVELDVTSDNQKKYALITGASSGIGQEFARQIHRRGLDVVLVARRLERLREIEGECNRQRPDSARVIQCDLSTSQTHEVEDFIESHQIDMLVCNAGKGSFGRFESLTREGEEEMVMLNVLAPMRLMHAVIPQMKKRRAGAIISVSSIAGFQPLPYMSTYAATKAFNFSQALGLRYELAEFGIAVMALCPGPVETEFGGVARVPGEWSGIFRDSTEDVVGAALRALDRRAAWITPCLRSKFLCLLSRIIPVEISTRAARYSLRGALRHVEEKK